MSSRSQAKLGRSVALHLFLTPLALIWLFPLWMMTIFSTMPLGSGLSRPLPACSSFLLNSDMACSCCLQR